MPLYSAFDRITDGYILIGMENKTHCQICERDIKAPLGFAEMSKTVSIPGRVRRTAHHGYQRPWQSGYQTESCFGAKWRPVEDANDAMQPYLDMVQRVLNGLNSRLYTWKHEPPVTLTVKRGWGVQAHELTLNRPEGFDPAKNEESYEASRPWTYENEYRSFKHQLEAQKREAEREIKRVSKRLADWKPSK